MPPQEDYKLLLAMCPSLDSGGGGEGRGRKAIGMVVWGEASQGGTRWSCHLADDGADDEVDEYKDHEDQDEGLYLEDDENEYSE